LRKGFGSGFGETTRGFGNKRRFMRCLSFSSPFYFGKIPSRLDQAQAFPFSFFFYSFGFFFCFFMRFSKS
jgi:hypothetical protein